MTPSSRSGFLVHLVDRAQHRGPALARRRPGVFEPRAIAQPQAAWMGDAASLPSLPRPRIEDPTSPIETAAPAALPAAQSPAIPRLPARPASALAVESATTRPHRTAVQGDVPRGITGKTTSEGSASSQAMPPARIECTQIERTRIEARTRTIVAAERRIPAPSTHHTPTHVATMRAPPRLMHAQTAPTRIAHPARSAAWAAPQPAAAPAPVQVTIGRVEIRGGASAPPVPSRTSARAPQLGLEDYLRQRHGSGR